MAAWLPGGRNQLQVRRAWVLFGNLDSTPFHARIGKMAVPFGLTDTIKPFTASTVWHTFGKLVYGRFTLKGEFARTMDEWPGTFNPGIPQFAASKVTSFDIGAKCRFEPGFGPVELSAEFSRFVAGPSGAP